MRRSTLTNFWSAHPTASRFLCLLLAAAPACDDPDAVDIDEDIDEDIADAADVDAHAYPLAEAPDPQAAGNWPIYEILPPVRMDDLKPKHYLRLWKNADRWHDMTIVRNDGAWWEHQPGTNDEPGQLSRDLPVYAGVDGEVVSCWRSSPYEMNSVTHAAITPDGGNFVVIKTTDPTIVPARWFYYAHMDTNTIPHEVCPKVSVNPLHPGHLEADSKQHKVCNFNDDSCGYVETYLPAGARPQVHAGQFIGRMGAVGNAAMFHLHMGAGEIQVTNGIDRLMQTGAHITFEHTWQAQYTGAVLPITWTPSAGMSIPNGVTNDYLLLWPGHRREETYSGSYRLTKLGGSTGADLLCHDTDQGNLYIDGDAATTPEFSGTDWTRAANWCTSASHRLHTGDFDGNGVTDLLCHDVGNGAISIDHGVVNASTGFTEFMGTDFTHPNGFCALDSMQLLIGDFDSDARDDLLCHDHANGRRWVDRAAIGGFNGTDESFPSSWCAGLHQRLHVGRFNSASTGDDLLCHDSFTGERWIDGTPSAADIINLGTPIFSTTSDTYISSPWCKEGGQRLFAANVVGTGALDELVCHDSDNGATLINVATASENYPGTSSQGAALGDCTAPYERVRFGDFNGDGREDLLCFDSLTGARAIDYAALESSPGGVFGGVEWATASAWCPHSDQSLH